MKKYYVYVFLNKLKPGNFIYDDIKFEYEPFYIGKGTGNRIQSSKYDRECPFKVNKINKIIEYGGEVLSVKLYNNLENFESLEIEKRLIKLIGRRDLGLGPLVNLTDGGDGRLSSPHSEDVKRKISETKRSQNLHPVVSKKTKEFLRSINTGDKNPMYGKTHNDNVKNNQSLKVSGINHPMYDKKHSNKTIEKIREHKLNINSNSILNSKVVIQYSLNNEFISEYESIKIASIQTGCSESIIGKCCRGMIKNPRKFIFKFKDDSSKILRNSFRYKKGYKFILNGEEFILIKRLKMSCVVLNESNRYTSIHKNDCLFIWDKNIIN